MMPDDRQRIISTLKTINLFAGLDTFELERVAAMAHPVLLQEGQGLHIDSTDGTFFVVTSGRVRYILSSRRGQGERYQLKSGDFFGGEAILRGKQKPYDLQAVKTALLFSFKLVDLRLLLNTIPVLTRNIKKQVAWYNLVHSRPFRWLGEEETVKIVCRKHLAYLFVVEIFPMAVAWLGVFVIFVAVQLVETASFRLALGWVGAAVVAAALLWATWRYFDWGNDYYIVTDQRIVWLERTIGLYDSRQEAPLAAIKSGESKSSQVGRWLGFGDVITSTFMGQVIFRHIGNPEEIKNMIDQERRLVVDRQTGMDIRAIEGQIRQKIEPYAATTIPMATRPHQAADTHGGTAPLDTKPVPEQLNFWQSLIAAFQTRRESSGMITYRKHLYVLFTMTWLPALSTVGLIVLTGFLYSWRVNDQIKFVSSGTILLVGILLTVITILWWLYEFADWTNDIYRVTPEKIIDSERKPLGDEITRSAPLENIIGLDYERIGILGVILNFGNVIINIGTDNKFIFYGIHNPARAQRDIFNYMFEQRRRKQRTDTIQEQDRVSSYIAAYHRQAEDIRQSKKPPQF